MLNKRKLSSFKQRVSVQSIYLKYLYREVGLVYRKERIFKLVRILDYLVYIFRVIKYLNIGIYLYIPQNIQIRAKSKNSRMGGGNGLRRYRFSYLKYNQYFFLYTNLCI